MRNVEPRSILGLLLVLLGVMFLLQSLGLVAVAANGIWSVLLGLMGLTFLGVFLIHPRRDWWSAIPGFTLLSLGGLIGLEAISRGGAGSLGGSLFLGGIGVSFVAVYLARREFWWAVIPAGVLLTLALVAGLSGVAPGRDTGALFLLGLSITFGLVYLIPTPHGRMTWALIPAGVLLVLAIFASAATSWAAAYVWPILLILVGLYLVFRNLGTRRG